jgi:hypothetical protein
MPITARIVIAIKQGRRPYFKIRPDTIAANDAPGNYA